VRRQLEQLTSDHTQLSAESSELRDAVAGLTSDVASCAERELQLKTTVDRLTAKLSAASVDRRLTRDLDDRRLRDVAVHDNIQVCSCRSSSNSSIGSCSSSSSSRSRSSSRISRPRNSKRFLGSLEA